MDKKQEVKMNGYIMAIDQGTTGTRVILFNHRGEICSMAYEELQQIFPQPGWVEHDPLEIWQSVLSCAKTALKKISANVNQVVAIGITNQRESTILWDKKTGQPVYNSICWQCRRSAEICEQLKNEGYAEKIKEKTGLVIDAYFSATKIQWILNNIPKAKDLLKEDMLCFGTIDSWIIWNLTGGNIHVTDHTNASRTLLYNIHSLDWDKEILSWLRIPENILPRIVTSSDKTIGKTNPEHFLGSSIPITGVAGDQQAATFGQACFHTGMAKNSYGTALALMMNVGVNPVVSKHGLTTDLLWKLGKQVEYALEGVIFIGGAAVDWLRTGLRVINDVSECSSMASKVSDTGGVYLVPAFTGLCAPYWDMYARGVLIGITRGTTREHIARSALESIAYQTKDVLISMEADSDCPANSLRVDGGATKSNFLMQFQADILGIPVERPVITEMASLGACYLAGLGIGFWESKKEIEEQWKIERIFEPSMSSDKRDTLYQGWKRAVERSMNWATS